MLTCTVLPSRPNSGGKHGDEQPGIDAVEQHLEDAVEGHQPSSVFRVSLRQFVPDNHHRNAAGQADHDEAHHVLRVVVQEQDGQGEHQYRADQPVLHERQTENLPVAEDLAHFLVADFRQRRVHHQDQTDGDRDVGRSNLEAVDRNRRRSGIKLPAATPAAIARKIHSVR